MRVHFRVPRYGPVRLVSEAEIHFEEGQLSGMRLLGFGLWRNGQGQLYVTFPSRTKGTGEERLYVDYLRSAGGEAGAVRRVKAWILDQYQAASGWLR